MNEEFLVEFVGLAAFLVQISAYVWTCPRRILAQHSLASVFWALYFFLMGMGGVVVYALAAGVRNLAGAFLDEKKMLAFVSVLTVGLVVYLLTQIKAPHDILPVGCAVGMFFICKYRDRPRLFLYLSILISGFWMTFHLFNHAYAGVINEIFMQVAIVISIFRYHEEQRRLKLQPKMPI